MSKHSDDKAEKQKKDKETVAKNDTRPLVLIVEDNADVAEYMSMQLRKRYQLAIAKDGEEGLRLATETVPDLIITDLMMPRMDMLCARLSSRRRRSIISLSSSLLPRLRRKTSCADCRWALMRFL